MFMMIVYHHVLPLIRWFIIGIVVNKLFFTKAVYGQSNNNTNSTSYDTSSNNNTTTTITNPWLNLNDTVYSDCDVNIFYKTLLNSSLDPLTWNRSSIVNLLTQRHRTTLSIVPTNETGDNDDDEDILSALIDLFPGSETDTVHLWFSDVDIAATPVNTAQSWRRGDVWPFEPTIINTISIKVLTDVHSKRPIKWTVHDVLHNLWFGTCDSVEDYEKCTTPATNETTADTSSDGKIKIPPAASRGDVARSLFYTALRYEIELGLRLTDCPPFLETDFGYLSTLLEWHEEDPVDSIEIARNNRACSRWQGNRNIFVDFPQLVSSVFGTPDFIRFGTNTYSKCTVPTSSPTASPNACSAIRPGDIQIYLFNSNNVPEDDTTLPTQVVFLPLVDITPDVGSLYLTDKGWNGTHFATNEGVVQFTIPEEGLEPAELFSYGVQTTDTKKGVWTSVANESDAFILSDLTGDNVFLYCLNADNKPHFIVGIIYNEGAQWETVDTYDIDVNDTTTNTTGTTTTTYENIHSNITNTTINTSESRTTKIQLLYNESLLPEALSTDNGGSVTLPLLPNYLYEGVAIGKRTDLIQEFANPLNWNGSIYSWIVEIPKEVDEEESTSSSSNSIYMNKPRMMVFVASNMYITTIVMISIIGLFVCM